MLGMLAGVRLSFVAFAILCAAEWANIVRCESRKGPYLRDHLVGLGSPETLSSNETLQV